jgi:predicted DNA binding CopG/RHH family protein
MGREKLSKEEKELLDSYENDEWVSVKTQETVEKYQAIARATLKKDKRINIRISERDLELIRERAMIEGIPYQTLITSVLHKYVTGRFSEKTVA